MNFCKYILKGKRTLNKQVIVGESLKYCELDKILRDNLKNNFKNLRNEKIGILIKNSSEFLINYLSILNSGNTAVLFENGLPEDRLYSLLKKFKINYLVTDVFFKSEKMNLFNYKKIDINLKNSENIYLYINKKKYWFFCKKFKNVALILFTSGSTGEKKGVMLTHKNLISNTNSILKVLPIVKNDIVNLVLPSSYSFGLSILNTHLKKGAKIFIHKSPFIGSVIKELNQYKCTSFYGVPSTFSILLEKTNFLKRKFPFIRYVAQAGGNLEIGLKKKLNKKFKNKLYIMYGITEASPRLSYVPPKKLDEKINSIGIPIPGVKLKLFKQKKTNLYELGASGKNIMKGYLYQNKLTKKSFKGNYFLTGDIGFKDKQNYFYITKRSDKTIKRYGYKINLSQIEKKIKSIEYISECKIFLSEQKKFYLIIQTKNKVLTKEKIFTELKRYFLSYELPDEIILTNKSLLNFNKKISIESLYDNLK